MWLEARAMDLLQGELAARSMAEHSCDDVRLHSALIEPQRATGAGVAEVAADQACALLRNRPFAQGNEAAAFLATALFLQLNGHELRAGQPEAVVVMLGLASGKFSRDEFAAWIRKNLKPNELKPTRATSRKRKAN
jgi:prophage maintenance system killer protein